MPANTTVGHSGRFCNHVILNIFASFIARKGELKFSYSYLEDMLRLGLPLYITGEKQYGHTLTIDGSDTTFHGYLDKPVDYNLDLTHTFVQNNAFSLILYNYFRDDPIMQCILHMNPYKDRFQKNNDVYVHVRLDDVKRVNPGYVYYENALKDLEFTNGYLSSDSPSDAIVLDLIKNFNLTLVEKDEVETIQFGSSCKYIVLSYGTFSWVIGALGFYSKVFIPSSKFNIWCNQSFDMPDWQIIDA